MSRNHQVPQRHVPAPLLAPEGAAAKTAAAPLVQEEGPSPEERRYRFIGFDRVRELFPGRKDISGREIAALGLSPETLIRTKTIAAE